MKSANFSAIAAILLSSILSACGGGDESSPVVVVNESQTLTEGTQASYTLPAGTYHAEITASNNGVVMNWLGGSACATSTEIKTYNVTCSLSIAGQLTILNPTLLGLGGPEVVTIKITKE